MILFLSFFLFVAQTPSLPSQDTIQEKETITVKFTFSSECKGQILISCFQNPDNFLDTEKAVFSEIISCQDSILVDGLDPTLSRSVIAFVDENNNKEIDLNFFGIPTEPYAVSNDFRGKWREPLFEDSAEAPSSKVITMDFKYWKEK